ncbi:toll/interleukin-1 receptor domain-containing protein [Paenibacillus polymyxa]|uniref:toll/interleukin-1 receptor domain-containing protein n=1 Tax=Paenibacillus polymyxa TaxID=1406 RepID=UPI002AB331E3|nr:toll/interleukin-1 receptor domain-containing protein [Paenibacillus polymyxa]MDY8045215.1 toll/interleukin-1 receptor domain-containing protein [Paenibacillus polymyxa]
MRRDFIIEFDYFRNRDKTFSLLNKIENSHSRNVLTGFSVFINNIPSSLEFYVYLSYECNPNNEIEEMKTHLFSEGLYRPDISLGTLFNRISERGFNSYSVDSSIISVILKDGFFYERENDAPSYQFFSEKYKTRLEGQGYKALDKLGKGTSIFLSHSSLQKGRVEELIPYLNSKNELVWIDKYRLKPTEDSVTVKREIATGLNQASKVLFYVTDDFLKSDWCNYELELAIRIKKEKTAYSLYFMIDSNVNEQFLNRYGRLLTSICQKNIKVLRDNENLEDFITDILN